MNEADFSKYLKRRGKKPNVIDNLIHQVSRFETFLAGHGAALDSAGEEDILAYVADLEAQAPGSARVNLRGVGLYFEFLEKPELAQLAFALRQGAIEKKRKPFKLSDFRGVSSAHLAVMKSAGVVNTEQMLKAGKTPAERQQLAAKTGVPVEAILELVKLSDLARLAGVKGIRARLYYDAGIDTLDKMAAADPEDLLKVTQEFVSRTRFEGIPPLLKEVTSTIENAKRLSQLVDYSKED
jgi:predicted flap endonuclease-1-like 5' DNA nuclease